MAHFEQFNVPLAGDILDDLAMAFREILTKVCVLSEFFFSLFLSIFVYGD